MREIMMSIQPKDLQAMERGEKKIVICKRPPHLNTPFKVWVYMAKPALRLDMIVKDGDLFMGVIHHGPPRFIKFQNVNTTFTQYRTQKVSGEFVCRSVRKVVDDDFAGEDRGDKKDLFCLEVSDFEIYGWAKELDEFFVTDRAGRVRAGLPVGIPRPWCYVQHKGGTHD